MPCTEYARLETLHGSRTCSSESSSYRNMCRGTSAASQVRLSLLPQFGSLLGILLLSLIITLMERLIIDVSIDILSGDSK